MNIEPQQSSPIHKNTLQEHGRAPATIASLSVQRPFSYWLAKNNYYHRQRITFFTFVVPPGQRVLQINCANGYLLHAVKPSYGVGVEADTALAEEARSTYQNLHIISSFAELSNDVVFDYIMVTLSTMQVYDIQELYRQLQRYCHPGTRVVVDSYSYLWAPVLRWTQRLGLRRPTQLTNWVSQKDQENFLMLADYEVVTAGHMMLMPLYIPVISWICNALIALIPGINRLCLHDWIIARPQPVCDNQHDYTVSVIVPCRNERGNIESAITRTPLMGRHTEFIFVEGHSHDGTLEEVKRVVAAYPEKDISWYVQQGKGKGDAVRLGFARAKGDILVILDSDLTTPPEELPKFVDALVRGKGEFINGSRMIYGMEQQAMRFLNVIANYGFSLIFTWLLNQRVKDTLCGTKVLFKKDYLSIVEHRGYFGEFDPYGDFDLLFGAAKLNLKIVDMPVHYKNRAYGTSQISRFQGGFLLLAMSLIGFKKFKMRW